MAMYRDDLSADYVRGALDYDQETGIFRWKRRSEMPLKWNSKWAGKEAGFISNGYRTITLSKSREDRSAYPASRLAWLIVNGTWPEEQIDHINGIRDDNRWKNLREASNAENNRNKGPQSNNKLGHRGISQYAPDRWLARINANGVKYHLGVFESLDEAISARKAAEERIHGHFAPIQEHRSYKRAKRATP